MGNITKELGGKVMKRILALILVLAMVATFCVACGKKADAPAADAPATNAPAADAPASSDKEVELSVILITGYEFYEDIIKQYEIDNPGVKVDVQIMPTTDYLTLIKTKMASNDAPDIMPVQCGSNFYEYYSNGYLADLSDMTETLERLNPGVITPYYVDGGVIGIPYTQEYLQCYYNRDLFAKNNLKGPTTWEEFLDACQVLKSAGVIPVGLGNKDVWVDSMLIYMLNATLVQHADPSFYKGTADGSSKFAENEGWLKSLSCFRELVDKGYMNEGSLSTNAEQMYEMFVNQETAMFFGGTWCDASVLAMNPEFEVGAFHAPAPGGNKAVVISATGGYGIDGRSENIPEAKKLLAYMLSKDVQETYAANISPCFSDVQADLSPALNECLETMKGLPGYQYDDTFFAPGVADAMYASLQELVAGTMDPIDVLEAMDAATAKANR